MAGRRVPGLGPGRPGGSVRVPHSRVARRLGAPRRTPSGGAARTDRPVLLASAYGGSCYLNNAAVAAEALRARGFERVAVLDVDAHHGNGTQQIFYDRGDVWYGSVHVDPGAGWFPHYVGFADETGSGAGQGTNHNRPLPPGSGDQTFLDAVRDLIAQASACGPGGFGAQAVVVSLGVDAAADDPESPLQVSATGFGALGELLAEVARAVPMVLVQEGGYHLPTLGELVATVLRPLRSLRG
ncbi:MAG: hypothetical protein IPK24_00035 [Kineosporiaceae bacterium]|nr:hypothetical protein [Kineosporiaceae bacterium]